jgi:glycine/D-amino acid oxidase-like deaminating enzyme
VPADGTIVQTIETEIAVIGGGIAGIATAYYLVVKHRRRDVLIVEAGQPMGFTTAQSGENYRDWWPHPVMAQFTGRSIELMEDIARDSANAIHMTRGGYALATRRNTIDELLEQLRCGYKAAGAGTIRVRAGRDAAKNLAPYEPPEPGPWHAAPAGVDVLTHRDLIGRFFPQFDPAVSAVLHIRRAGDISAQQLGQFMLERHRSGGGRLIGGTVDSIEHSNTFRLTVAGGRPCVIRAETIINAAGPFLGKIAGMLNLELPVENILQQKIAFEDRAGAIPRQAPFSVDLDPQILDWSAEERQLLLEDAETAWLAERLPGGAHCRPDGGLQGNWVKLGWAYNTRASEPVYDPSFYEHFPDMVLRGAAALQPALKTYYAGLPRPLSHYGGYYTMTRENWPLIGPMGIDGAFMVGALSGFGTMAACAAGELCADWIGGDVLPAYALALSLARYEDHALMVEIDALASRGVL